MDPELKIIIGDEYKIKVEPSSEFSKSIFKEVYTKSAENVNEIIRQAKIKRQIANQSDFLKDDDYNNIIAFIGERGSGKSSSMVSFAEALISNSNAVSSSKHSFFKHFNEINDCRYVSIEMIDTSLFRDNDTLLEIIISKMFLKFQKEIDRREESFDYEKKRTIITQFQKVFNNLKTLHSKKESIYEHDTLDALSKLANGSNLKENLRSLVSNYLTYFKAEDGFLLIAIDDFDLNTKDTYPMLEDVRQYLIQSNIIVLVACKIEQLQDSLKLYLRKVNDLGSDASDDDLEQRSNKYLEKLLPLDHRKYCVDILKNSNKIRLTIFKPEPISESRWVLSNSDLQNGILHFIYLQTGVFISKPKFGVLNILPNTLRGLVNFINTFELIDADDVMKNDKKKLNIVSLERYILELLPSNISTNQNNVNKNHSKENLKAILNDVDSRDDNVLNLFVIHFLNNLDIGAKQPESLIPENASFGDVVTTMIEIAKEIPVSDTALIDFTAKLRVLYAIRIQQNLLEQKKNLYDIVAGEMVNENSRIFRGGREVFKFNGFKDLIASMDQSDFSLFYFISTVGKEVDKSKEELHVLNQKNNSGAIENATFNAFSFLINSLFPEKIDAKFGIESSEVFLDWKDNLQSNYYLFFNIDFFTEFIYQIGYFSKVTYKDKIEGYSDAIFQYLTRGASRAFRILQEKYPYLNLYQAEDSLSGSDSTLNAQYHSNPAVVWLSNSNLLDFVFRNNVVQIHDRLPSESSVSPKLKSLATHLLNKYQFYFSPQYKIKSRGAKQAMSYLIKNFEPNSVEHIALIKIKDTVMASNVKLGLNAISDYLKRLSNG